MWRKWSSEMNPLVEYLMKNPGHAFNTAVGGVAGMIDTRSLPKRYEMKDGDPRWIFEGREGQPPKAMGDVLIEPPDGMSERSVAHEDVHRDQSRDLGFGYLPLSGLGGYTGPLEHEALAKTSNVGDKIEDKWADGFAFNDAQNASMNSQLQNILYRMYYGR